MAVLICRTDVLTPRFSLSLVQVPCWPQCSQDVDSHMHNLQIQPRYSRRGGTHLSITAIRSHHLNKMTPFCPLDTRQFLLYDAIPCDYPTNAGDRGGLEFVVRKRGPCGICSSLDSHHPNCYQRVNPLRCFFYPTHAFLPRNWGFTHG